MEPSQDFVLNRPFRALMKNTPFSFNLQVPSDLSPSGFYKTILIVNPSIQG